MNQLIPTELDYLAAIRAARAIDAVAEIWDAMTGLAMVYISEDMTQEAADLLAFVLLQTDALPDTVEYAADLFADLASRLCPRVIWDAKEFASEVTFTEMMDYVFAGE